MNTILKSLLKLIIPYIVKWLVVKVEKEIKEAKTGSKKKDRVIQEIIDFCEITGFSEVLDKDKLSKLIDDKVKELINKI